MDVGPEGGAIRDGQPAPAYRVMVVAPDGAVRQVIPIPAETDAAAMMAARHLVGGDAADLWDGLRFVERFERPSEV